MLYSSLLAMYQYNFINFNIILRQAHLSKYQARRNSALGKQQIELLLTIPGNVQAFPGMVSFGGQHCYQLLINKYDYEESCNYLIVHLPV